MTAPDFSLPESPNLKAAFAAFAPPGTDPDELMAALKASRMPEIPLDDEQAAKWDAMTDGPARDLPGVRELTGRPSPFTGSDMTWCRACSRPHPASLICPEQNAIAAKAADPDMPADPSPGDLMAGIGIAQMLESMTSGGVPLASAERIIGAMLAVHGIMAAADQDDDR